MLKRTNLFIVTAILEGATGLALLLVPSLVIRLLLGIEQAAPESHLIAQVFGAALAAIGVTCYLSRNDHKSPSQTGVLIGVLFYNTLVAALLAYAGAILGFTGLVLWPAVVLHILMSAWCLVCLVVK